jgi:hypothetical protein
MVIYHIKVIDLTLEALITKIMCPQSGKSRNIYRFLEPTLFNSPYLTVISCFAFRANFNRARK